MIRWSNHLDVTVYRGEIVPVDGYLGFLCANLRPGQTGRVGLITKRALSGLEMPDGGRTVLDWIDPAFKLPLVQATDDGFRAWT